MNPAKLGVKVNIPPMVTMSTKEDGDNLIVFITVNCPWQLTYGGKIIYGNHGERTLTIPNDGYPPTVTAL